MWLNLIQRAAWHRMEGDNDKYTLAIDTIIRTLLKSDREHIKKLKKGLFSRPKYGIDERLGLYDDLLEGIVDKLEDSGYLTKDFVLDATTVRLEPDED